MLRKILLSLLGFPCFIFDSFSQQKLYDSVSSNTCYCLTKKRIQSIVDYPDIANCIKMAMMNNLVLINEEVKRRYPDSSDYNKGYLIGQELGRKLDTALVYSCDTYFLIVDSLRFTIFNQYNKDSALTKLLSMKDIKTNQTSSFFMERAKLNFLTSNYKEALEDIEEGSKSQENKNALLMIKGPALDRVGRYHEATTVFYRLNTLSGQNAYLVSAAIENRKAIAKK